MLRGRGKVSSSENHKILIRNIILLPAMIDMGHIQIVDWRDRVGFKN